MWLEKLVKVYSVGVVCDENVLNFILTPYDNSIWRRILVDCCNES